MVIFMFSASFEVHANETIFFNTTAPFGVTIYNDHTDKLNYLEYTIECGADQSIHQQNQPLTLRVELDRSLLETAFKISNRSHDGVGIGKLNDLDIWASFAFEDPRGLDPVFKEDAFDFIVERMTFSSDRGSETGTGWTASFGIGSWPIRSKTRRLFDQLSQAQSAYLQINSWDKTLMTYKLPDIKRADAFDSVKLGCRAGAKN